MSRTQIGIRIAAKRYERGWSQPELAARVGVHVNTIKHLEHGVHRIDVETLESIARAFGTTAADFLRGSSRKST